MRSTSVLGAIGIIVRRECRKWHARGLKSRWTGSVPLASAFARSVTEFLANVATEELPTARLIAENVCVCIPKQGQWVARPISNYPSVLRMTSDGAAMAAW